VEGPDQGGSDRGVEESTEAAVDRGSGGLGRGTDRVAARRLRLAEGGGQGGCRWPPGACLAGAVLLTAAAKQRQELGGRGAADGEGARAGRRWGHGQRSAAGGCVGRVRMTSVAGRGRTVIE
jgi:hypothetical protein